MVSTRQLARALKLIGSLLDVEQADYCWEGRFRFPLPGEFSLVISPDDAGRFRLEVSLLSRVVATLWCFADDRRRLEELVLSARHESAALTQTGVST